MNCITSDTGVTEKMIMTKSDQQASPLTLPYEYPEILADLANLIHHRLSGLLNSETAAKLALELAEDVRLKWGGGLIYIPKGDRHLRYRRDSAIWRAFNGHNHADLARQYGLGIAAIYDILERERVRHQHDLFQR